MTKDIQELTSPKDINAHVIKKAWEGLNTHAVSSGPAIVDLSLSVGPAELVFEKDSAQIALYLDNLFLRKPGKLQTKDFYAWSNCIYYVSTQRQDLVEAEISVVVRPGFEGQGLGTAMVHLLVDQYLPFAIDYHDNLRGKDIVIVGVDTAEGQGRSENGSYIKRDGWSSSVNEQLGFARVPDSKNVWYKILRQQEGRSIDPTKIRKE